MRSKAHSVRKSLNAPNGQSAVSTVAGCSVDLMVSLLAFCLWESSSLTANHDVENRHGNNSNYKIKKIYVKMNASSTLPATASREDDCEVGFNHEKQIEKGGAGLTFSSTSKLTNRKSAVNNVSFEALQTIADDIQSVLNNTHNRKVNFF